MEALYQRRCAQYIYVVPEGLRELMSDISREILREQPKDLYVFITTYLEALMITRENARVAAKAISHMAEASEIVTELLQRTDMSRDQANQTVKIIQKAFRKHLRQKEIRHEAVEKEPLLQKIIRKTGVTHEEVENAVIVIQRTYRLHKLRRMKEQEDVVDWRRAFVRTMELYRKSRVTPEEASRAATLIKAAYKGYYTRRVVRKFMKDFDTLPDEEKEIAVHTTESWQIKDSEMFKPEEEEQYYMGEEMKQSTITEDIMDKTYSIMGEEPYMDYEQIDNLDEEVQLEVYEYGGTQSDLLEPTTGHDSPTDNDVNDITEVVELSPTDNVESSPIENEENDKTEVVESNEIHNVSRTDNDESQTVEN